MNALREAGADLDRMLVELYGSDSDSDEEIEALVADLPFEEIRNVTAYKTEEDRRNSLFWKSYIQPVMDDPNHALCDDASREGITFRRRFRVPYSVYQFIVHDILRVHRIPEQSVSSAGVLGVNVYLLVLGCL